jgi:N-acetylglucosaminyl-diphospho-decaprenol L-rhamnosyltransferase
VNGRAADPALAVVVVTWNSSPVIGPCLRSILDATGPGGAEIVVVDNASSDGTVEEVRKAAPEATVIANGHNRGLAAANNQGLAATTAAQVLICNADVEFRPGAIAEMRAVMARHDRAAWVVPRLILPDGTPQTSVGDPPGLATSLFGRQAAFRRSTGEAAGFWWDGWPHDEERAVGRGHEAAYLVRRAAIDEVGAQDERYVLDWEGMDWSDRFSRAGWQTWLAPDAEVLHQGGHSVRRVPFRSIVAHHRGMYLYFSDRRPGWWRPFLAGAFAARAAVKLTATAAGRPLYRWEPEPYRRDRPPA